MKGEILAGFRLKNPGAGECAQGVAMSMDRQEMYRELLRKQAIADRRALQPPAVPRPPRPVIPRPIRPTMVVPNRVELVTVEPDPPVGAKTARAMMKL